MLNLKKGLALVLAAATAFTFAPVANLGNAVQAEAATYEYANSAKNVTLNIGDTKTYTVDMTGLKDNISWNITSSNPAVAEVVQSTSNVSVTGSASSASWLPLTSDITIKGLTAGTTTLTATFGVAGQSNNSTHSWVVTVNPASETPSVDQYNDAGTDNPIWDVKIDSKSQEAKESIIVRRTGNPNVIYQKVDRIAISDETVAKLDTASFLSVAKDTSNNPVDSNGTSVRDPSWVTSLNTTAPTMTNVIGQEQFTALKSGKVQVTIYYTTWKNQNGKVVSTSDHTSVDLKVVATESSLKVNDTVVSKGNLAASSPIVKRIELSADNLTAALGGSFSDAQWVGEGLYYSGVKEIGVNGTETVDPDYKNYNSTDLVVDSKAGTVTATAHALTAIEKYYDIAVSNAPLDANSTDGLTFVKGGTSGTITASSNSSHSNVTKVGIIRIVCKRDASPFTTVTATVNGKTTTAKASYKVDGSIQDDTKEVALPMSTADLTSVPFEATSNLTTTKNFSITSNDPSTVSVENGKLVAHKTGIATITAEAKSDATHYGNATVKVNVSVTAQYINNKVLADATINLNRLNKKAAFNAQVNPATTLTYEFVKKDATGAWVAASDSNLKLDQAAGTVEYTTTAEGSAVVKISGAATNTAAAPAAAYVTVNYTSSKIASKLNVETKSLTIGVGKTGTVVASGTAISFKSNDDSIATVDATTGVVTGVKEGVATITVTDAGNADYQGSSKDVTVYVSGNDETTATPAKVTGVKVTNLKGGKVKVTWTKQNQKNIKYYVKKTVGKKSAGKSVGSNKTTLSVKKGATVKVKVKAYIYDATGKKLVGSYSNTVTKKTDKK